MRPCLVWCRTPELCLVFAVYILAETGLDVFDETNRIRRCQKTNRIRRCPNMTSPNKTISDSTMCCEFSSNID